MSGYFERKIITREMLRAEPNTLFVFGDNMAALGLGGQAKEMRGEHNAVGIPTKWEPTRDEAAYFKDEDLKHVRPKIDAAFLKLTFHMLKGGTVIWPSDGIGTGLAELPKRAPAIWQLIESGRKILADSTPALAREILSDLQRLKAAVPEPSDPPRINERMRTYQSIGGYLLRNGRLDAIIEIVSAARGQSVIGDQGETNGPA